MTTLNISPGLWSLMKQFGYKENPDYESRGGVNEVRWNESSDSFGKMIVIRIWRSTAFCKRS